jgi:hypothetical protein
VESEKSYKETIEMIKNRTLKLGYLAALSVIVLQSCGGLLSKISSKECTYKVNIEYLESSCKDLYNSFKMSHINVNSFDNSIPKDYTKERTVWWGAESEQEFSKLRAKGLKKLSFNTKIEGGRWYDLQVELFYDVLPLKLDQGEWYVIEGLQDNTVVVFFYVEADERFKVYEVKKPTNY